MKEVRRTTSEVFSWIATLECAGLLEAGTNRGEMRYAEGLVSSIMRLCCAYLLYFASSIFPSPCRPSFHTPIIGRAGGIVFGLSGGVEA